MVRLQSASPRVCSSNPSGGYVLTFLPGIEPLPCVRVKVSRAGFEPVHAECYDACDFRVQGFEPVPFCAFSMVICPGPVRISGAGLYLAYARIRGPNHNGIVDFTVRGRGLQTPCRSVTRTVSGTSLV